MSLLVSGLETVAETTAKAGVAATKKAAKLGVDSAKYVAKSGSKIIKSGLDDATEVISKVTSEGLTLTPKSKLALAAGAGLIGGYGISGLINQQSLSSYQSVPSGLSSSLDVYGAETSTLSSDLYEDANTEGDISQSILGGISSTVGTITGIPSGVASTVTTGLETAKVVAIAGSIIAVTLGGVYVYKTYYKDGKSTRYNIRKSGSY